jgi:hypothetical protein
VDEDEQSRRSPIRAQQSKDEMKTEEDPDVQHSIKSHPDITKDDEIEIKILVLSLSQRYERPLAIASLQTRTCSSLLQHYEMDQKAPLADASVPSDIASVKTTDTTPVHSNNIIKAKKNVKTSSDASSSATPEGYNNFLKVATKESMNYKEKAKETNTDILELINSKEPDRYAYFVETLKDVISGSHSQLWQSFRSLFRRGEDSSLKCISKRCC